MASFSERTAILVDGGFYRLQAKKLLVTRPPRNVQMSYFHTAYATSTRGVLKRQASTGSSTTTAAINESGFQPHHEAPGEPCPE